MAANWTDDVARGITPLTGATTTLAAIREHQPCRDRWTKLLTHLSKTGADDEPLSLLTILESNGLGDVLWCLRALPDEYDAARRLLACDYAERALAYVPEGEDRPRQSIEIARRYARGDASEQELFAARDAALAATDIVGGPALDAAWSVVWAVYGLSCDTRVDVLAAAVAAGEAAGEAAATAAESANEDAWRAERREQERILRAALTGEAA